MIHKIRVSKDNQCIGCVYFDNLDCLDGAKIKQCEDKNGSHIFVDIPDQLLEPKEEKTLRDEFAIAVINGLFACTLEYNGVKTNNDRARTAYEIADLMLAERAKVVK